MVARTLTQHAVPTTFGLKAAQWLTGVLDAYDDVAALAFPVQVGGAAGTMAGDRRAGRRPGRPGARRRPTSPIELADRARAHALDAVAHLAGDRHPARRRRGRAAPTPGGGSPATCSPCRRPEIGELSEGAGGGSSTMPHKANPVLSTLVRRAALSRAAARGHPAPGRRRVGRRARRRRLARRVGDAAHAAAAYRRRRRRRRPSCSPGLQVHADRMGDTLADGARRRPRRAASRWPSWPGATPTTTTSERPTPSSRRRSPAPPACSRRSHR